jgi:ubiquitin C-terminal hydrolase
MDNKPLDFSRESNNNYSINGDDEVIDLKESKPINDPECEHQFKAEDSDDFEGHTAWTCVKCGRGTYLPNNIKIT